MRKHDVKVEAKYVKWLADVSTCVCAQTDHMVMLSDLPDDLYDGVDVWGMFESEMKPSVAASKILVACGWDESWDFDPGR